MRLPTAGPGSLPVAVLEIAAEIESPGRDLLRERLLALARRAA